MKRSLLLVLCLLVVVSCQPRRRAPRVDPADRPQSANRDKLGESLVDLFYLPPTEPGHTLRTILRIPFATEFQDVVALFDSESCASCPSLLRFYRWDAVNKRYALAAQESMPAVTYLTAHDLNRDGSHELIVHQRGNGGHRSIRLIGADEESGDPTTLFYEHAIGISFVRDTQNRFALIVLDSLVESDIPRNYRPALPTRYFAWTNDRFEESPQDALWNQLVRQVKDSVTEVYGLERSQFIASKKPIPKNHEELVRMIFASAMLEPSWERATAFVKGESDALRDRLTAQDLNAMASFVSHRRLTSFTHVAPDSASAVRLRFLGEFDKAVAVGDTTRLAGLITQIARPGYKEMLLRFGSVLEHTHLRPAIRQVSNLLMQYVASQDPRVLRTRALLERRLGNELVARDLFRQSYRLDSLSAEAEEARLVFGPLTY